MMQAPPFWQAPTESEGRSPIYEFNGPITWYKIVDTMIYLYGGTITQIKINGIWRPCGSLIRLNLLTGYYVSAVVTGSVLAFDEYDAIVYIMGDGTINAQPFVELALFDTATVTVARRTSPAVANARKMIQLGYYNHVTWQFLGGERRWAYSSTSYGYGGREYEVSIDGYMTAKMSGTSLLRPPTNGPLHTPWSRVTHATLNNFYGTFSHYDGTVTHANKTACTYNGGALTAPSITPVAAVFYLSSIDLLVRDWFTFMFYSNGVSGTQMHVPFSGRPGQRIYHSVISGLGIAWCVRFPDESINTVFKVTPSGTTKHVITEAALLGYGGNSQYRVRVDTHKVTLSEDNGWFQAGRFL